MITYPCVFVFDYGDRQEQCGVDGVVRLAAECEQCGNGKIWELCRVHYSVVAERSAQLWNCVRCGEPVRLRLSEPVEL